MKTPAKKLRGNKRGNKLQNLTIVLPRPQKIWRASLIRSNPHVLGDVDAASREAAEATAVRTFNLNPQQRSRLVVEERG